MTFEERVEANRRAAVAAEGAARIVLADAFKMDAASVPDPEVAGALCEAYCKSMGPWLAGHRDLITQAAMHVATGLQTFSSKDVL